MVQFTLLIKEGREVKNLKTPSSPAGADLAKRNPGLFKTIIGGMKAFVMRRNKIRSLAEVPGFLVY
jgi:hypothetical protein